MHYNKITFFHDPKDQKSKNVMNEYKRDILLQGKNSFIT